MKRKQVLALGMAAALTVSMSTGTVSLAAEADTGQQSTVELNEEGGGGNAVSVNNAESAEESIEINAENFPDEAFREYVSEKFDKDDDGVLSPEEVADVTSVKIENRHDIQDLTGIQYFASMTILNCKNTGVTALDVTGNPKLRNLNCAKTQVASLDVSKNPELEQLYCSETQIAELDLSGNPDLIKLECNDTNLSALDLSKNPDLTRICCHNTKIETLDLAGQTEVSYLNCSNTEISSLDVSGQANLQNLYCGDTEISELDLSSNPKLSALEVENANLSALDVSGTKVSKLKCKGNPLYTLSLGERGDLLFSSTFPESTEADLEVPSSSFDLEELLPGVDAEKVEIVSGGELNGTVLSGYEEGTPVIYKYHAYDAEEDESSIQFTVTLNLTVVEEGLAINAENFPDEIFRAYVEEQFDEDGDQSLSQAELDAVKGVKLVDKADLKSLKGIEYFTNLTKLHCFNTGIAELDVSANVKLETLSCYSTDIAQLDVTNLTALKYLFCDDTKISSLDVTNCPVLERLECNNTLISSIDVRNNPKLTRLECCGTAVSSLDLSQNPLIMTLKAENTQLSTLNLEVNNDLQTIELEGSPIYAMSIGDKTTKTKLYLSETVLDFEVAGESVDLTALLPGMDPAKVTIVSGGILEGNMLSGYANGTPVVYTYDFGQVKNQAELRVTLNITFEEKAEPVVFASVNGTSAEGESLQAAVESAGLSAEDVTTLTIESGKVTQEDLAYIKTLPGLEELTMNFGENLQLIGKDGNPTTVLSSETAVLEFAERSNGSTPKGVLQTLTLGGITEIQESSLKSDSVKAINMPDVVTVGTSAFCGVPRVEDLDLSSAKVIGQSAFFNCKELDNLTLKAVETLEKGSFKYTDSLKNLTLPATLKTIENIEFGVTDNGKKSSAKLTMLGSTPPTVTYGAFDGVGSATSQATVTVPAGALQNYLNDINENADAEGVIQMNDTQWNDLYLKEDGSHRIEYNTGTSWETQYAFIKTGSTPIDKQIPTAEAEDGYEFAGWNTKKDGTGDWVTTETIITKDIKVFPVFEEAVVNVTAEINGQSFGGETLKEAVEASGIKAGDVESIKFVSGNVTKDDLTYIKEECDDLESLVLNLTDGLTYENGSTALPTKAFTGMRYLESAELGGFTEIGERAFQKSGIVSVDIPDATTIKSQAFEGCTALESVNMPSVEMIGSSAFYWTDSLMEVTLPASIESLDGCGFATPESGTMDGFHLIIEKTTPPELNGSVVGDEGTVSVPAGALSAYLDKTDFDTYFTSTGDISWAGLIVEDPSYSMVTFRGDTGGQAAYAYVADGTAVTEKQMPVFTKDGYVLDSWNTERDGTGTELKAGDSPDGSMIVYAQWKEEVKDEKAPTAQISTGGTLQNIDQENPYNINISLKFHDETSLDYYVLNDKVSPTKLNGTWGDGNYQNISAWLNEGNGEDGRNTLTVYDKAGNFTTYTFYVDQTKPELAGEFVITPDNNTMSTSKTVTFTTTEPVEMADGWTQAADSDGMKWQKEFAENFKGTVQFTDAAGNTSDAYVLEVKRIENVKPEAEILYSNNGEPTNEDVVVTVKTNVECLTPDGWEIVPGAPKRNQFQKTYSENAEETVTLTSLSGIETDITVAVTGIDKTAPEAAVEYSTTEPTYESVLVTIRANEPICTPEGWTKVDDVTFTKEYTHNVDRNVNIYDLAGNGNDVDIRITNIVEKPEDKEITVSYVFEKNGKEVGTEKIRVDAEAYNFNTSILKDVPEGYEIVYVGDTLISKDNTAEVTVRKAKKKAEATLIIWLTDEWGNQLFDKHGDEMKVEITAKGPKGEYHTFTKDDWKMPKGYEYASDTDKWYAEQEFRVKYGETLDTLHIAVCPVEKNNKNK